MVYKQLEKTDFEVLSFLISNINKEYSIKELSDELKRPYVKVHKSIQRLKKNRIIKEKILGKSHYCSIDYENNLEVICFIDAQRANEFLEKNKKISLIISNIIMHTNFPNYSLVLFGSYAKDKGNKHSDIDIAIITSTEDKEKAERVVNSIKRTSSFSIHSLEFTYNDFIEMLRAKENNVGKEIAKKHIIFKGCEQFYNSIILSK